MSTSKSVYRARLEEDRKHLGDDAVIERALNRIEQDEQERDALREQNAAMREIVAAMADAHVVDEDRLIISLVESAYELMLDAPDGPGYASRLIERARALLSSTGA